MQKFEEAKFCLEMTSLYFTCMANGNSKMYTSNEMISCIEKAGLTITEDLPVGISHTLFVCIPQDHMGPLFSLPSAYCLRQDENIVQACAAAVTYFPSAFLVINNVVQN